MTHPVVRRARLVTVVLAVFALLVTGCSTGVAEKTSTPSVAASTAVNDSAASAPDASLAPTTATSSLPTVRVSQLPPQAVTTLELIEEGGPFPYERDGVTFQNREGILPSRPQGFYSEYTVVTPGSKDRGARRIVAGDDGSRFYTDDHYDSFREVVSG